MKSYQFFKICKRFGKEREKTLMQQSVRKEKLRKATLCFITGCFIKFFNIIINHFFCFTSSFPAQFLLFDIRMTQEVSKGEAGNGKELGMANDNIYFKNNFNRFVMKITHTNFLYWKNVHIWRLIKVNYKKFVVRSNAHIKNTLMKISKLSYMFLFIQKQNPESFAFVFPRTLKLFAHREVCKFLKK